MPEALEPPQPDEAARKTGDTALLQTVPARAPRRVRMVAVLPLLLIIAAVAYVYAKGGLFRAWESLPLNVNPDLPTVFGKPQLRLLVMGLDENWTANDIVYTAGARTDTLIAVSIDLASKNVGVVSIPRDLWVKIPHDGYDRINDAYSDGGPEREELAVEQNLGTPPFDYYFVLRVDATKNIVDALDGLNVNVEKDMDYDDAWGHLHIHLRKGMHHLNGSQVVGYVRFRHDEEGDFGRMRRQRQVVQILARRLKEPSIALRLPALLGLVRDNVRSNMPADKMLSLAMGLRDVTPQMIHTAQIPADPGWVNGASVLFAQETPAREIVRKYLADVFRPVFDRSAVHVTVENGSGRPGAASAVATLLRHKGFTVVRTGNAGTFNNAQTTISSPDPRSAGEVARQLPMRSIQIAIRPVPNGDVDVVVGQDYRAQ